MQDRWISSLYEQSSDLSSSEQSDVENLRREETTSGETDIWEQDPSSNVTCRKYERHDWHELPRSDGEEKEKHVVHNQETDKGVIHKNKENDTQEDPLFIKEEYLDGDHQELVHYEDDNPQDRLEHSDEYECEAGTPDQDESRCAEGDEGDEGNEGDEGDPANSQEQDKEQEAATQTNRPHKRTTKRKLVLKKRRVEVHEASDAALYDLAAAPWLVWPTTDDQRVWFRRGFLQATRRLFGLLRTRGPRLHPNTIVAPELGHWSAYEIGLLWMRARDQNQRERKKRFQANCTEQRREERKCKQRLHKQTHAVKRKQAKLDLQMQDHCIPTALP